MHIFRIAILIGLVAMACGCARSLPLISHAHIGHTLTTWRDTPDEQGLFVVTEKESRIAMQQAELARNASNTKQARRHLNNVVNALNPDINSRGPGLGYGAIRALQGSADHVRFAATAEDASQNVIRHADRFTNAADALSSRFQVALRVAELAANADDSELPGLNEELELLLQHCVEGDDVNSDGKTDRSPEEAGLVQLREQLSSMIKKEKDPPYHPLGRKYLLGLVRLPNGTWVYKFNRSADDSRDSGY